MGWGGDDSEGVHNREKAIMNPDTKVYKGGGEVMRRVRDREKVMG